MLKKTYFFLCLFNLLIVRINPQENMNYNTEIIDYCLEQNYNISDVKDDFFNDICSIFYSKNKRDITLEYRRKYYYYPNYERKIILNETLLKEEFPNIKRDSIFSCFNHYWSLNIIINNLIFFVTIIIFLFQITSYIFFIFIGSYKDASVNNIENYLIYIDNKKKKSNAKNREINVISYNTETNVINNDKTNNGFSHLKEEMNQTINEGPSNSNQDTDIGNLSAKEKFEITEPINTQKINNFELPHILNNKEQINNNINNADILTFGNAIINIDCFPKFENNQLNKNDKKDKKEDSNYIYGKLNNIPIKKNAHKNASKDILTNDELFYSSLTVVLTKDKRNLKQIYFDILSHCQIILFFKNDFFIYEDKKIVILYYSIKFYVYIIINIVFLNKAFVINKIYDNKYSFLERFIKCLIATIIVNLISQILFIFTNSKRIFIKHINKLKFSLYRKDNLLKLSLKEIIEIINNNLRGKMIILCFLNILIFSLTFYYGFCFCSTYYYTQFIVLINIIICIIISQIFPFLLVLIPAYLRIKAIKEKNEKLYLFSKYINLLFLP